jgi:cyclophilin family peptidyl-prolyl cis-trans isomerase
MTTSLPRGFWLALITFCLGAGLAAQSTKLPPGEYATFVTNKGTFVAQLYPDKAPQAVANFVALAEGKRPYKDPTTGGLSSAPLYAGLLFFRTQPGAFIQVGDPLNTGTGSLGYTLPFEKNDLKFDRPGRMALAQSPGDPTSRGSQIFFTLKALPEYNADGFLIVGQIVRGLNVAIALSQGPRRAGTSDIPRYPNTLKHVTIQDVK